MSVAVEQQILGLDARYSAQRGAPKHHSQHHHVPAFRTLYLRRRTQLLRSRTQLADDSHVQIRADYLNIRALLLAAKFGPNPAATPVSGHDRRSLSWRNGSHATLESAMGSSLDNSISLPAGSRFRTHERRISSSSSLRALATSNAAISARSNTGGLGLTVDGLVPTWAAEASRAMAGGSSLGENYAFCGVYHIFDVHKSLVTEVHFAHDDLTRLASSSSDGSLAVHVVLPEPETLFILKHPQGVTGFCWSAANDLIMSCSHDGLARLFNSSTGYCVRTVHPSSSGGSGRGAGLLCCVFQPLNNNMILTGSATGWLQVTNCSTGISPRGGTVRVANEGSGGRGVGSGRGRGCGIWCVCFDTAGRVLWAGDELGFITAFSYSIETGRLTKSKRVQVSSSTGVCSAGPVTCISMRQWSSREAREPCLLVNCGATNSHVAKDTNTHTLALFRILPQAGTGVGGDSLLLRATFPLPSSPCTSSASELTTGQDSSSYHWLPLKSSFCPLMSYREGACVVSGAPDGSVYFFNTAPGCSKPCINKLQAHSAPVVDITFTYDESMLASCDANGQLIVWRKEN